MSGPQFFAIALAATNAAALGSWAWQWRGLISDDGVLPVRQAVEAWREKRSTSNPATNDAKHGDAKGAGRSIRDDAQLALKKASLFAILGGGDAAVVTVFLIGALGVLLLATGWLPAIGAALCYASLISLHGVSQPWLGLQMDVALPEADLVFAALYSFAWASPSAWIFAMRWLVFRTMVACGIAKWTGGDPSWRSFGQRSAMSYHYETQPMPNGLSQRAHWLPGWVHGLLETGGTYFAEIAVPLLYFAPFATLRALAFVITLGFNATIGATGNYGHLHLLTVTEAIAVLIPFGCGAPGSWLSLANSCSGTSSWLAWSVQVVGALLAWLLALGYAVLSCPPLLRTMEPLIMLHESIPGWDVVERWSKWAERRLHICNYYSKFTHMTKSRPEIVIEVALSIPSPQQGGEAAAGTAAATTVTGATVTGATGAGGTTQQLPERRWYQLQLWGKPGGDIDLLSETPPTLPIGLIYRWSWRSWFVASAVARVAHKGVPFAALGVEEWVRRTVHALLQGRASVWRAVVRPSPTLRTLEVQGLLPFLQAQAAPRAAAGVAAAGSPQQPPSQLQPRIDAVRISVYDYKFQPLLGWPATGTQGAAGAQVQGAEAVAGVGADSAAAAASGGSDKAAGGSIGARRGIPLSPPLPQPYSTTGTFPLREAGSVWERTRLCTYYIAQRQDVTLSAAEIFGGGCLHVAPLVEKLPLPATA